MFAYPIITDRDVEVLCQIRHKLGDGTERPWGIDFLVDDEEQARRIKTVLAPGELGKVNLIWIAPFPRPVTDDRTEWGLLSFPQKAIAVGLFLVRAALGVLVFWCFWTGFLSIVSGLFGG